MMAIAVLQATAPDDDFPRGAYVMVQCVAGPNNSVNDCRAIEVSHPGQGFERTAMAVVRRGQIGQSQGVAVGQAFRIKINFRLDDGSDEPAPPTPNDAAPNTD
ncbi:MAG: energy transducer TonB [Brevundimonas sp.]